MSENENAHHAILEAEPHCEVCAALGYLGSYIDHLEGTIKQAITQIEAWGPQSTSSTKLREFLADALPKEKE